MGNSQYRRQHYITYHGYKYSLPSVAGFIWQSGDYYLFPPPAISGGQSSERVKIFGECQRMAKVPNGIEKLPKISNG